MGWTAFDVKMSHGRCAEFTRFVDITQSSNRDGGGEVEEAEAEEYSP